MVRVVCEMHVFTTVKPHVETLAGLSLSGTCVRVVQARGGGGTWLDRRDAVVRGADRATDSERGDRDLNVAVLLCPSVAVVIVPPFVFRVPVVVRQP